MVDRTNYFQPGELIYSGEPYVSIVRSEVLREYCEGCFKREVNLKRCASCKYVSYCGKKCQKKSWQDHQMECKYLHRLPTTVGKDFTRLLGKVVLKVKGKNLREISDKVGPHTVRFDELSFDSKTVLTPAEEYLRYLQYATLLKEYLGQKNLPQEVVLRKIIDKTFESLEQLHNCNETKIGIGLYIGILLFDHSCIPNAVCVGKGDRREIRAIAEIPKSNWKSITVSRTFIIDLGNPMENPILKNCKCADCSAPYGESLLTKIIDKRNAFFILQESRKILQVLETSLKLGIAVPDLFSKVNSLLQKQEGILADTNILRLRLMYCKNEYFVNDPYEKKADLKKFIHLMERVFGKYSAELMPSISRLQQINMQLGCTNEVLECAKKLENIRKIIAGETVIEIMQNVASNVPTPNEFQDFLRGVFNKLV